MLRIEALSLALLLACACGTGSTKAAFITPSHEAGYQRTLVSGNSRYDRWRHGKEPAALTEAEQADFGCLVVERPGEGFGFVPLVDMGCDFGRDEIA